MFFWNSLAFFHDPADVGNLISGSSGFSKTSLNIRKFTVHRFLKPVLENFEHYFTSMWDKCNWAAVWAFFWHCLSLDLEWKLTFSSPVATAEFSKFSGILSAALSQHHPPGVYTHLLCRADSLENTLMLRKIEGKRRRGQQRMRWFDASLTQ